MDDPKLGRRLAAILAADVVGYSRLMEANEEETLLALLQHRAAVIDPAVQRHGGRVFKVMGDGFLMEFASVVAAMRCAVDIQRGMAERHAGMPEDRHFKFRMGVNLGDILIQGDDVYGDGVNMAVRLQTLAGPGGIACSAAVRGEIGSKLDLGFLDQGRRTVKNITQPVHVYFVDWAAGLEMRRADPGPAQVGPNRPSVAILPFANLSRDPDQEFFSDGVTEDIITDLSNVSGLFVLSRNTVFAYRHRARDIARIANELGVAYVVEGSVRRSGNRVRINCELTEGATDSHIWAARFDRDLTDIFAVQDEIAKTIVAQLKVKLLPEEQKAIEQAPTASVEAYTHFLRGRDYAHIASRANHLMARQSFARALEIDPGYARAYAGIAVCDVRLQSIYGATIRVDDIIETAGRALAIDPHLAEAHAAKAFALTLDGRLPEAVETFEQALAIDPDCHEAHRFYGEFCVTQRRFEDAARLLARAMEIKPTDYGSPVMLVSIFRSLGEEEKARAYARIGIRKAEDEMRAHPENANCACLGATMLAFMGESRRAVEWLDRSIATDPGDINIQYNAACTYALLGEAEKALDVLEAWVPNVGEEMRRWFRNDSDFTALHNHPRYRRLIEATE